MKALTLHRPWCWAILHAGKDVENRTWAPPSGTDWIALHAGRRYDGSAAVFMRFYGMGALPTETPEGIVGVARIDRVVRDVGGRVDPLVHSPWWVGPVGWALVDVHALERPVPARGRQRLWDVPLDVERAVLEQLPPDVARAIEPTWRGGGR